MEAPENDAWLGATYVVRPWGEFYAVYAHYEFTEPDVRVFSLKYKENADVIARAFNAENHETTWDKEE